MGGFAAVVIVLANAPGRAAGEPGLGVATDVLTPIQRQRLAELRAGR